MINYQISLFEILLAFVKFYIKIHENTKGGSGFSIMKLANDEASGRAGPLPVYLGFQATIVLQNASS